jgi:crossover junction endodeoxyribonuclease RusA
MREIRLIVFGTPVPQGSTRAFIPKGWKRPIITADNRKTKPWRQEIAGAADEAMRNQSLAPVGDIPIAVSCDFFFDRPKSLKKAITEKMTKPDVDKLVRTVLDALTGVAFKDDAQVVSLYARKWFSDRPRAEIAAKFLEPGISVAARR